MPNMPYCSEILNIRPVKRITGYFLNACEWQDSQPRVGKHFSIAHHRVPPWLLWTVHCEIPTDGFKELQ